MELWLHFCRSNSSSSSKNAVSSKCSLSAADLGFIIIAGWSPGERWSEERERENISFSFDFNSWQWLTEAKRNFHQQGHFLGSFCFHYHGNDFSCLYKVLTVSWTQQQQQHLVTQFHSRHCFSFSCRFFVFVHSTGTAWSLQLLKELNWVRW